MPLVDDDEDYYDEKPQQSEKPVDQQVEQEIRQKGKTVWDTLSGIAGWIGRRKLPEEARQGLKGFGQEIWYSKAELAKKKRLEGRQQQGQQVKGHGIAHSLGGSFHSFGPKENKKKRKGKL